MPRVTVEGGRKPHIVRYTMSKGLKPFIEFRHSMFERVYPINERLANKMLQTGYKQPSKFGRWCPVKVLSNFSARRQGQDLPVIIIQDILF